MGFRQYFRGKKEWLETTNGTIDIDTNDEAAKWYDASLSQLCGWYEDDTFGGLAGSMKRMFEADPNFKLGQLYEIELNLMGALNSPRLDQNLAKRLDTVKSRIGPTASEQEKLHLDVVLDWAEGNLKGATRKLEKLVTRIPEDILALKMLQDLYFVLGTAMPMRNSIAHSLYKMSDKNPLKGYVHGMYSFALEESNMYAAAQAEATKALELIPRDTWAIHNYAHCLEMQGKVEEGLKWMGDKKADWLPCQMLACHQFWHTALFHINNNQFQEAVNILDQEVIARCTKNCTSLDLVDAASMIYRMELAGLFEKVSGGDRDEESLRQDRRKRWSGVYQICEPHGEDHLWGFNDAHFMMSYLGMDEMDKAERLVSTIKEAPTLMSAQTVENLLEAMRQFHSGNYSKSVDLLEDIRFEIINLGGSHAQRDVFEQLLLVAALRSSNKEHNKLGERMLLERESFHGRRLPQTELLAQQGTKT